MSRVKAAIWNYFEIFGDDERFVFVTFVVKEYLGEGKQRKHLTPQT